MVLPSIGEDIKVGECYLEECVGKIRKVCDWEKFAGLPDIYRNVVLDSLNRIPILYLTEGFAPCPNAEQMHILEQCARQDYVPDVSALATDAILAIYRNFPDMRPCEIPLDLLVKHIDDNKVVLGISHCIDAINDIARVVGTPELIEKLRNCLLTKCTQYYVRGLELFVRMLKYGAPVPVEVVASFANDLGNVAFQKDERQLATLEFLVMAARVTSETLAENGSLRKLVQGMMDFTGGERSTALCILDEAATNGFVDHLLECGVIPMVCRIVQDDDKGGYWDHVVTVLSIVQKIAATGLEGCHVVIQPELIRSQLSMIFNKGSFEQKNACCGLLASLTRHCQDGMVSNCLFELGAVEEIVNAVTSENEVVRCAAIGAFETLLSASSRGILPSYLADQVVEAAQSESLRDQLIETDEQTAESADSLLRALELFFQ